MGTTLVILIPYVGLGHWIFIKLSRAFCYKQITLKKNCPRDSLESIWAALTKYQTDQLINNRNVFITVLDIGNLRS